MIKINLLGESTVVDNSGLLFLAGWGASLVLVLAVLFIVNTSLSSRISALEAESAQKLQELTRLQEKTKEVKDLERMKAELNNKLAVIATLRKSKSGPVRVLDDLNKSLPERAWLSDFNEKAGQFTLTGRALDDQTVARFMKDLDGSEYFDNVDLDETKLEQEGPVKIRVFKIVSKVNYAGKLGAAVSDAEGEDQKSAAAKQPASRGASEG